jgi:putative peptide zinc metalloprotease protein
VKTSLKGVWEAQKLNNYLGTWVSRGQILGQIIGPETIRLRVVVDQDEAARLFHKQDFSISFRVAGRPDIGSEPMPSVVERIIPIGSNWLPSAALGYSGGGHQAVDQRANDGQKTLSNVFEVWLKPELPYGQLLLAGQRVVVRFAFPEQPLSVQWLRKVRQLVSKRYMQG